MIYFSPAEILCSLLHAVVFGMGFSFFYQLFVAILRTAKSIPGLMNEILFAERIFPFPSVKGKFKEGEEGGMTAFLSVIFFFLGFLLLSYFSLDGRVRIYMLVVSSASLYAFNYAFSVILGAFFCNAFDLILAVASTVIRCVMLPFKLLFRKKPR